MQNGSYAQNRQKKDCLVYFYMIKYVFMSREMMNSEVINNPVPGDIEVNQVKNKKKTQNKVDINLLMSRVREDEKKEKKESIFFFSLLGCVLVLTGIIASL